ncbi:cyclase family protein [Terricaulis silvestris]|uniref:Kynurenine formamidase n=1 Tax=Terricaulis silvestris TaxID=2686094 RepID=A0A6I6MGC8_9CAUL|nr:cyclase family protein [Terricaulis silvestris]QGZ93685.1 Kynurenine formamidase [Terricaulis silvestris]
MLDTPANVATWLSHARTLLRAGEIVELSHPMTMDMPHSPNHPPFMFRLTKLHGDSSLGGDVSASSDMFTMGSHNGTHIDGLGHIACGGIVAGGLVAEEISSRRDGFQEIGIETVEPLFLRGVLLDVARHHGRERLEITHAIGADELETVAAAQGVEVMPGDAVLIRTGWAQLWADHSAYVGYPKGSPGVTGEAAAWLGDRGVRTTGTDTFAYDVRPAPQMPAHVELMVKRRINIMENLVLEELSRRGVFEFMFCALPLRIVGGTGSPIRPIALY